MPLTDSEASDLGVSQPLLEASDCATCCSTTMMRQPLVQALSDCERENSSQTWELKSYCWDLLLQPDAAAQAIVGQSV